LVAPRKTFSKCHLGRDEILFGRNGVHLSQDFARIELAVGVNHRILRVVTLERLKYQKCIGMGHRTTFCVGDAVVEYTCVVGI